MKVLVQHYVVLRVEKTVEADSLKDAIDAGAAMSLGNVVTVRRGVVLNDYSMVTEAVTLLDPEGI